MMMLLFQPIQIQCCAKLPPKRDPKVNSKAHTSKAIGLSANAHNPFDQIPISDAFAWNALIRAHLSDSGDPRQAILVYHHMLLRGARPDKHTIPRVIAAARLSSAFFEGRQLHCHALKLGFASDDYVVTALMQLQGQLGGGADAAAVVLENCSSPRNSVSWTLLAKLYAAEGKLEMALRMFHGMAAAGVEFDTVALAMAANACGKMKSLSEGRRVHELARGRGLEADVLVGNSLTKMYIECEEIEKARALFDRMPAKDAVSWTTMVGGYVQRGGFNEGLKLFHLMCVEGVRPDAFAVSAVLPACSRMAAHKNGKEIHGYIVRNHADGVNSTVHNALMDMYVKSGSIEAASKIFGSMAAEKKDAISYTVMILGCSLHGRGELGVALFHEMELETRLPIDTMVLAAALHACSTACLVEEGRRVFDRIREPQVEHYALMAGLLARAGFFEAAVRFAVERRVGRHAVVQMALLAGCRVRRNVQLGKQIAEELVKLEPLNAENYVLLSNLYAANGNWEKVKELKGMIQDMGLKPKKACSWIEIKNKVHVFGVGDVKHPRSERIYWELQGLRKRVEEDVADDFSLHDVDEERECDAYGHSETLAIGFGLISTERHTTIRVTKNLQVCRNCHALAKMVSKIFGRVIVLKDPGCFHHLKDGICSCRDLW